MHFWAFWGVFWQILVHFPQDEALVFLVVLGFAFLENCVVAFGLFHFVFVFAQFLDLPPSKNALLHGFFLRKEDLAVRSS